MAPCDIQRDRNAVDGIVAVWICEDPIVITKIRTAPITAPADMEELGYTGKPINDRYYPQEKAQFRPQGGPLAQRLGWA